MGGKMNTIPIKVRPIFASNEISTKYCQNENSDENSNKIIEDISLENKKVTINLLYIPDIELNNRKIKINNLLEKIKIIKSIDYTSEGIEQPTQNVFWEAEILIPLLAERNIFPYRISESAEGGICFYFKNNSRIFYFEIYNDGEKGFIIEDTIHKKIIKNVEIKEYSALITELKNFYA